jgi:hypothetical protein
MVRSIPHHAPRVRQALFSQAITMSAAGKLRLLATAIRAGNAADCTLDLELDALANAVETERRALLRTAADLLAAEALVTRGDTSQAYMAASHIVVGVG